MPGFSSPLVPFFALVTPAPRSGFQTALVPWLGAAIATAPRHRLLLLGVR